MYKITNISGCLIICGLYPGKSKTINNIDAKIKELYEKQLISLVKVKEEAAIKKTKVVAETEIKENKECEVLSTDGRN